MIPSGHSWYFELEKKAREIAGDIEMNLYSLDGMYKAAPQEPLRKTTDSNLSASCTADRVIDWLAIGGDWQPFPCSISYKKYTLEDQLPNKDWSVHFAKLLAGRTRIEWKFM